MAAILMASGCIFLNPAPALVVKDIFPSSALEVAALASRSTSPKNVMTGITIIISLLHQTVILAPRASSCSSLGRTLGARLTTATAMFLFAMDTAVLLRTTVGDLSMVATTATGTRLLTEALTEALSPAPKAALTVVPRVVTTAALIPALTVVPALVPKVLMGPMVTVPRTHNLALSLLSAGLVSKLSVCFHFLL
jgi:hypothetical protein